MRSTHFPLPPKHGHTYAARRVRRRRVVTGKLFLSACFLMLASRGTIAQQTLTLQQAINEALTSPNAQVADDQVAAVRGQVRQAKLRINPRVYLESEDLRPWASNFSFLDNTTEFASIGQVFELGGKRLKRVALATANLNRAEAERTIRTRQITGAVALSYWSAVSMERVAALLVLDLAAMDNMVRYHQERVTAGAMRGVDLVRIQIERDRIFLALQAAERDAQLARIDLFRQIGRAPQKGTRLTDDLDGIVQLPPVNLPVVLAQRADLIVARDQLTAAEADLRLQRAVATPDPDFYGGLKRNSGTNTAYASVLIPLPFQNRNQGEIERAQAQIRVARANFAQAEILARADIEAATENYQREQQIVQETLPEMRSRAKQNLQILTEAYRIGGVDLLRFIDAERTAIDVEVSALRTLSDYHQSVVRLQLASGDQL